MTVNGEVSAGGDEALREQIEAIAELPLEQRVQALADAEKAIRELLDPNQSDQ